jgi:putative ABC transport system ATP-binding protein
MLKLEGLCRDFPVGDQVVHALDHLDLIIEPREYVSIMGPSGSGKSTLLNMIGLLDSPTAGDYWLDEISTSTMNDDDLAGVRQKKIGFVFQSFHLVPRMSASENVELPMLLAGLPPAERREKVMAALGRVGLENRSEHRPDQLSGGERQRVAMARAVVMQPSILLADEPTGNLDSHSGKEIVDLMEDLNTQGLTLIIVTHDPAIGGRARRRIRMEDGRIVSDEVRGTAGDRQGVTGEGS